VSGGLPRLSGVAARPVNEVEHLLQDLDDGNLAEERGAVGGCAGVSAADWTVHKPVRTGSWRATRPRAVVRDRGEPKNMLDDIQGAVGELIGLALLYATSPCTGLAGDGSPSTGMVIVSSEPSRRTRVPRKTRRRAAWAAAFTTSISPTSSR
jgi:hypothetical protein